MKATSIPIDVEDQIWLELQMGYFHEERWNEALAQLDDVISARRFENDTVGLIWAMGLRIGVLTQDRGKKEQKAAAEVGEAQLKLRRGLLASHPKLLASALGELVQLYSFEGQSLNPERSSELATEAEKLHPGVGNGW